MLVLPQASLWCPCGSLALFRRGRCRPHYWADARNRRYFASLRERTLFRDGGMCLVCGEIRPEQLIVHHRAPRVARLGLLATLCRGCHARVHHLPRLRYGLPAFLETLWREQHRDAPAQLELAFAAGASTAVRQVELFVAA